MMLQKRPKRRKRNLPKRRDEQLRIAFAVPVRAQHFLLPVRSNAAASVHKTDGDKKRNGDELKNQPFCLV